MLVHLLAFLMFLNTKPGSLVFSNWIIQQGGQGIGPEKAAKKNPDLLKKAF